MGRDTMDDVAEEEITRDRAGRGSRLRLIKEKGIDIDEESSEYDTGRKPHPCSVTCCGFFVGSVVTALIAAGVLFVVMLFALSYTGLDNGLCNLNELGIGRVCVSCPSKTAKPEDAARICRDVGSEVARFAVIKALVDRVGAFAPPKADGFIATARMSESSTTCVKATASGAASVACPETAAVVCQRPRPLGNLQESIRKTRVAMGVEPDDLYSRHALMFAESK